MCCHNRTERFIKDSEIIEGIMEASPNGIYIVDKDGYYITANKIFEAFTGINPKELEGQHTKYMVEQKYITNTVALDVLKDGQARTKLIKYPNGKYIMVSAAVIRNKANEIVGAASILNDVTALNKMREEISNTQELVREYKKRIDYLQEKLITDEDGFIGNSTESKRVICVAEKVAKSDATVLITGQSGVGKEVIAKFIHEKSNRKTTGSFIKVDCASLPATLLESELFGYESGAFTNARKGGKLGMFEIAHRGTLFLDEIGELPIDLQAKILNAVQNHEIKRIGGVSPITIDTRIISATNRNLEDMVKQRLFREDLYYRLNVVPINIPALRERKEDIMPLIIHFLAHFNKSYGVTKYLAHDVINCLTNYDWPGNVRSLKNTIERLVVMSNNDVIMIDDLPEKIREFRDLQDDESVMDTGTKNVERVGNLKGLLESYEKKLIKKALNIHGNLSGAAYDLGIDLSTLTRKNRKYGIKREHIEH